MASTKEEIIAQHKFLDSVGLQHVWSKVKSHVSTSITNAVNGLDSVVNANSGQTEDTNKRVFINSITQTDGKIVSIGTGLVEVAEVKGPGVTKDKKGIVTIAYDSSVKESTNAPTNTAVLGAINTAKAEAKTTVARNESDDNTKAHLEVSTSAQSDKHNAYTLKLKDVASASTVSSIRTDLGTKSQDPTGSGSAFERIASLRGSIQGGTFFKGVVDELPLATTPGYKNGDIIAISSSARANANKEFIYSGETTKGTWVELGDTTAESNRIKALEDKVKTGTVNDSTKFAGKEYTTAKVDIRSGLAVAGAKDGINGAITKIETTGNSKEAVKVTTTAWSEISVGKATNATNATYATKIGKSGSTPKIGSVARPVYVDEAGTITAIGTDLGSAAFVNTNIFATSAQGTKADTALQSISASPANYITVGDKVGNAQAITLNVTSEDSKITGSSTVASPKLVDEEAARLAIGTAVSKSNTYADALTVNGIALKAKGVACVLKGGNITMGADADTSVGAEKPDSADTLHKAISKVYNLANAANIKAGVTSVTCEKANLPTEFITSNKTTGAVTLTFHHVEHTLTTADIDTLLA